MIRFCLTRTLPLVLVGTTLLLCALAPLAQGAGTASPSHARSVALSDARRAPDHLYVIKAHASRTISLRIALSATEVSAYTWTGGNLPGQRWNEMRDVTRWGSVTFDGRTVTNPHSTPVLFAMWEV